MPKVRVIQATKGSLANRLPVAAYCRVSSNSEDQRHSFVAQVREYTARIAENDKWELAGIPVHRKFNQDTANVITFFRSKYELDEVFPLLPTSPISSDNACID